MAPLNLNFGAKCRGMVNVTLRLFYPWDRSTATVGVEDWGGGRGPVWKCLEMRKSPNGIRKARSTVAILTELPRPHNDAQQLNS